MLARPPKLIPKVMKAFGRRQTVDEYINQVMIESQKELLPQAHFVASSAWQAIYDKYSVLIKNEEDKILYLCMDVMKNAKEIQKSKDLVRSMRLLLDLTDKILETFNRNQNKEGEATKTEPKDGIGSK